MSIPQETIDLVRERISIVELISESVSLKRSGRNHVGLCPFHKEKTPSFSVREEEGTYHCFGCEKSGTIFNFVMETRGFTFPEAVRFLAARAGVTVEETTSFRPEDDRMQQHRKVLRELLLIAERVFREELQKSKKAQLYLESRGLTADSIEIFRLGFAPNGWEFLLSRVMHELGDRAEVFGGISGIERLLCEVGLLKRRSRKEPDSLQDDAKRNEQGAVIVSPNAETQTERVSTYDCFRNRIIFPIARSDGGIIALGGRTLETGKEIPKYINSSESPVYQKRKTLFGLHLAIPSFRQTRQALLVEGYMDVISLFQRGVQNVVATCGTAVTSEHVQVLKRFVDRVLVVFDGDEAGRKAASRCFEVFLNSGLDVSAVLLPDGEDPDSFSSGRSAEECQSYFESQAVPLLHLFVDTQRDAQRISGDSEVRSDEENGGSETQSPAAIGKIATTVARMISQIKNPVEREFSLRTVAEKLSVSINSLEEIVHEEIKKRAPRQASPQRTPLSKSPPSMSNDVPPPTEFYPGHFDSSPRREAPSKFHQMEKRQSKPEARNLRADRLPRIHHQLIVAVLTDTSIAKVVLEMPTFLENSAELDAISDNVKAFLRDVLTGDYAPIQRDDIPADLKAIPVKFASWISLLEKHQLDAMPSVLEACRLLKVGGSDPKRVVPEVIRAAQTERVRQQVDILKIKESQGSEEERLSAAQQKLLTRRSLQRLRPSGGV